MSDTSVIALSALSFGVLTWLLATSYFLGKHSARVDVLEGLQKKRDEQVQRIFDKLDALTKLVPHVCYQAERIARLEERTAHGEDRDRLREEPVDHNP